MSTQYLKKLEKEITEKLERYKADIEWLKADLANSYPQLNSSPSKQSEPSKPSVKSSLPTHKKESLLKLSPQEFAQRYQKEGSKFADAFYAELAKNSDPPRTPAQPQQQYTFINLPPKYSAEEIMKRVKDGESLLDIINDHQQ